MKFNVKFAPEQRKDKQGNLVVKNVPIFADIRFAGTRMFYFTGYRIDADKFTNQQAQKNSTGREGSRPVRYDVINRRLKSINATLELYFQSVETADKMQIKWLLNDVVRKAVAPEPQADANFYGSLEKYHNDCNLSQGRKERIIVLMNHLKRYQDTRGMIITFDRITVDMLRDFENYLHRESTSPRSKNNTFFYKPVSINTAHSLLSLFRTFWNYARKEMKRQGIELQQVFGEEGYQLPGETYGEPVYITADERNILFGANLQSEYLRRVRDIFVFQCLIGARVGDLCKMTKANIVFVEKIQNDTIQYIPRKTKAGKPVTAIIPLTDQAKEILSRYNLPDGRLLPFITDQRYNVMLKNLFKEVGINRIVTRLNPNTAEPEQVPICDIVSSHMARRAFVGLLYNQKVNTGTISSMSGHVEGSRAFTRYYKVDVELQQDAISKL